MFMYNKKDPQVNSVGLGQFFQIPFPKVSNLCSCGRSSYVVRGYTMADTSDIASVELGDDARNEFVNCHTLMLFLFFLLLLL